MIFDTPLVLWRSATGSIHAMEDRCAHRRTALSAGKVVKDGLQCAYHGWTYDERGACVRIPSLGPGATPPERICVRSYPTVVRYGLVWVWWGDEQAADAALIPDVPFIHPEHPKAFESQYMYDCSSDLLVENLIDLTHLDFVHGWLLGDPYGGAEEVTCTHTDEVLTMQRRSKNRKPPTVQAPLFGFPKTQDIVQTTRIYLRSNCAVAAIWYNPPGWGLAVILPNVPERAMVTRNDFSLVVNGPIFYRKMIEWTNLLIGWQDNGILKVQQPAYHEWEHTTEGRSDRAVAADKPCLRYRGLREQLLRRQQSGDFAYASGWQGPPTEQVLEVPRIW
jgi:phenylpropionate dioxygenase-like ring-hydroxylating dioxygenase large terminal subunit